MESEGEAHSPQRERPLLVPAHAVPVDGGGAGHGVQVVGAVGQGGHPLAVPLSLLLPGRHGNTSTQSTSRNCPLGIRSWSVDAHCALAGPQVPVGTSVHPRLRRCLFPRLPPAPALGLGEVQRGPSPVPEP